MTGQHENIRFEGEFQVCKDLAPLSGSSYVPELKHTLLSVSQATETWGASAIFDKDGMVYVRGPIHYDDSNIIARGFQKDGLYWTKIKDESDVAGSVSTQDEDDFCEYVGFSEEFTNGKICEVSQDGEQDQLIPVRMVQRKRKKARIDMMRKFLASYHLWHVRFGHKKGLRRMIMYQGVIGLPKDYGKLQIDNDFCVQCLRGKQRKRKHVSIT
jgi:hypothetical protein